MFIQTRKIPIFFSGLGIGWVIGLSLSPVVHVVVASIVALAAAVAGTAAGVSEIKGKKLEFNPVFVCLLILGIAMGAPLGILARTNAVFGPSARFLSWRWPDAGHTNAPPLERALLENVVSRVDTTTKGSNSIPEKAASATFGLYASASPDLKAKLVPLHGTELRAALINAYGDESRKFFEKLDTDQLETFKQLLCAKP